MTFVAFGPKRHLEMDASGKIIGHTESGVTGLAVEPPGWDARLPDGTTYRVFGRAVAQREADFAAARLSDPNALRPPAPWDRPGELPWPYLLRRRVSNPEVLRTLPGALGARVGSIYWTARSAGFDGRLFVALALDDPTDWQNARWLDKATGQEVEITTEWGGPLKVIVIESLDGRTCDFSRRPRSEPLTGVIVDRELVAEKGRVSPIIDAALEGETEGLAELRLVHRDVDGAGFVVSELQRLGPAAFSDKYDVPISTSWHISAGRRPSRTTIARVLSGTIDRPPAQRTCALDGCDEPVAHRSARYCTKAHADAAYRQRRKARELTERIAENVANGEDVCERCGMVLLSPKARELHPCREAT